MRKRLRATGLRDSHAYLSLLDDPISGAGRMGRLEAEITIGETFFFRYAEQFAALRETILPEIVERKSADTAAAHLERRLLHGRRGLFPFHPCQARSSARALADWRVSILGTDINDELPQGGAAGAVRQMGPALHAGGGKRALLHRAGKEQWQVRPEFRSLVRFERHNLLSLLDGTSPLEFTDFDLILCRNVLIYFHPDTVTRSWGPCASASPEDGWMLLGHAEPNPAFSSMMQVLNLPGTVAYRRGSGEATAASGLPASLPLAEPNWKPLLPAAPQAVRDGAEARAKPATPAAGSGPALRASGIARCTARRYQDARPMRAISPRRTACAGRPCSSSP